CDGIRCKCAYNNLLKCQWNISPVIDNDNQRTDNVKCRHKRNHKFGNFCNTFHSACENEQCNNRYNYTCNPLRNTKCRVERRCDRVRLNCITHETKCENQKYRKNRCKHSAECTFECCANVVNRSTCYNSVAADFLVLLCHNCLAVDRRHAKECCHPHPEYSTWTADRNRCRSSCNITSSYLSSNRCRQRLERTHSVLSRFSFFGKQSAECTSQAFREATNLNETGTDG